MYKFFKVVLIIFFVISCALLENKLPETTPENLPQKYSMYEEKPDYNTEWWKEFKSKELNKFIEIATKDNFNLLEAYARLEQAKANAAKFGAYLYPELSANAGASKNIQHKKEMKKDIETVNYSLGLSVSYELDIWGRVRNNIKKEQLLMEASKEDVNAAIMSITGQIVETWLNIISINEQIKSLEEQLRINQEVLKLIKFRFKNGKGNVIDILQQQQSVAAIKSALIPMEQNKQLLKHQLALLLGKPANYKIEINNSKLPEINSIPKVGLPADLISMRPDIRAAGLRLKSANWAIAVAKADRLPRLSLSASLTYSSDEISTIFDNWIANLAANLVGPIFDGGRRKNEVKRVKAVVDERLATYKKTVITAIKEVEDALIKEKYGKRTLDSKISQYNISNNTLKQASMRYLQGKDDYLPVLREKLNIATYENSIIKAKTDILLSRIQLYKSLGGTWTDKYFYETKEERGNNDK